MNCPTCGAQNQPNAAFCSQCATNLLVPPGAPPPNPYGQPYGHQPYGNPMGYGQDPAYYAPIPTRSSGMAIAGFVLSFFCGLLGLIFSCIGYSECKKSNGQVTGEGLAIAGIVISILQLLMGIVWWSAVSRHSGRW
jgi:Domain of unknown function (DUF4190)/zinc-ribbon domain